MKKNRTAKLRDYAKLDYVRFVINITLSTFLFKTIYNKETPRKHHGMRYTRTYKSWLCMKARCGRRKWYENIKYAPEWEDFRNFYRDMGERPEGMTLDRIDPKGNYCKENCRWADYETQSNNRRDNKKFLFDGELLTIPQIARKVGISKWTLYSRVFHKKMSLEEALKKNTSHVRNI